MAISTKAGNLISLDMILIDEKLSALAVLFCVYCCLSKFIHSIYFFWIYQENLMHASVRKHLVPRFEDHVHEGLVYSLRNLKVTSNGYPYRPLASNLKLIFLATTAVQELGESDVSIRQYGFEFVDQSVLQKRANDPTVLSGIQLFSFVENIAKTSCNFFSVHLRF